MDFQTLSRRQLQSLCKKNKIRANTTNVAMANALSSLPSVEGIEEFLNSEISQSSMVPPTGGRTTTRRKAAAAASTSARTKIEVSSNKSLDKIGDKKGDVSVKTPTSRRRVVRETSTVMPVYSIRRSARLDKKIDNSKEKSEAIKIYSFAEKIDGNDEVEMKESSVDQSETSEITVLDNFQKILTLSEEVEVKNIDEFKAYSEDKSDIPHVEDIVASGDIKADTELSFTVEKETKASTGKDTVMNTDMDEDTEMSSNVDEETHASTEMGTEMHSNLDEEETAMTSNVEEEIEASIEEKTIMNFNLCEETKASNETEAIMDEETKDIAMNYDLDEEPMAFIEKDTILDEEDTDMDLKKKSTLPEEIGLKNNDESEANLEESSDIPNGAVAVASIENRVATEIKTDTDQEEDGPADGLMKDDDAVETKAEVDEVRVGTEMVQGYNGTDMNAKLDKETMAFIDPSTDMTFKEDGGIVAELKGVGSSNVDNEPQCNHGEQDKELEAYPEDIENDGHEESDISKNKSSEDEESDISDDYQEEFCVPEVGGKDDMGKDEPLNGKDISVTEFNQEEMNVLEVHIQNGDENETSGKEESDMSDENEKSDDEESDKSDVNETLYDEESYMSHGDELEDDKTNLESDFAVDVSVTESNQEELAVSEDIDVSKVEIQDEDGLLNSKAKHESYPIHIVAPLENDDASSIEPLKAPRSVQRLSHILKDDKENAGTGRKSGSLKDGKPKKPLEDSIIVELAKMLQDNWNISKQQNEDGKEDEDIIKSTTTRPALKALSENCMGFQSQN